MTAAEGREGTAFINSGSRDGKSLKKKKSGRGAGGAGRGCYLLWGGKGTPELRPGGSKTN